jgi:hypothetical protein
MWKSGGNRSFSLYRGIILKLILNVGFFEAVVNLWFP